MRVVKVALGERSYRILIGSGLISQLGTQCANLNLFSLSPSGKRARVRGLGQRCAIITDTNVERQYGRASLDSLKRAGFEPALVTVPPGERSKSLNVVEKCYDRLAAHRLERNSFIVAVGGGVVGDLAGFVAATYLRGIPFVQVPTTLLAQVDSSVGGKVGVNLRAGKNLVGAFHQPKLVLCDLDALGTLPQREFRAGLAEVIKYGIIYDARLFASLEKNLHRLLALDGKAVEAVVARCCNIKAEVVSQDERESGLRSILNFGHTIGHAIEAISGYEKYLHGEAISIGQVAAARLSAMTLGLSSGDVQRITQLFARADLPTSIELTNRDRTRLLDAMRLDKKVSGGETRFVLAECIGKVRWGQRVPMKLIEAVLDGDLGQS